MALPINIKDLIYRRVVENARVEYKRDWNPENIIHSICAFANDIDNWGGGYIVIGVGEENGMPKIPVTGLEKSSIDRINKELMQKCNLIEPRYMPIAQQIEFEGKDIIVYGLQAVIQDHINAQSIFLLSSPTDLKRRIIYVKCQIVFVQISWKKKNYFCSPITYRLM